MATNRRKITLFKKNRSQIKPFETTSTVTTAIGAVTLVYLIIALAVAISGGGESHRAFGALGTVSFFACLLSIIEALRHLKDEDMNFYGRTIGFVAPLVSFFAWLIVYIIGSFVG